MSAKDASEEMLNLSVKSGKHLENPRTSGWNKNHNKTGETDQDRTISQLFMAKRQIYILCIMSEGCPEENGGDEYTEDF